MAADQQHDIAARLADLRAMVPEHAEFVPLAEALGRAAATIEQPMQLAVIGKISSSKSTLVNAVLGKDELLPTGQKEVTFNVCWLKYGDPQADVVIHHKDSTPPRRVPRRELDALATIEGGNLDNISYIEIFDDAEILRDINIIDTPGLDALRKKDSQNTLDFIQRVHPDAVIMLFTKSMHESVLDIVRDFNGGETSFTPLNAIGVLTKIDVLWKESEWPRQKSALELGDKTVRGLQRRNAMLSKTLFDIYPVSALMYLNASTLDEAVYRDLRAAFEADADALRRSLVAMPLFLSTDGPGPLTPQRRKEIADKIDLYGVAVAVDAFAENPGLSFDDLRRRYLEASGAERFSRTLYSHFGLRARLIKIESASRHIASALRRVRGRVSIKAHADILAQIEQRVADTFSSLAQEHREYELLNAIYNHELDLDDDTVAECCRLFGEQGSTAPQRLGLPDGTDTDTLLGTARAREKEWRRAMALEPDPAERRWMAVVLASYEALRFRIQQMKYAYNMASAFLFNK